jgi:hypothetical protein
MTGPPGTGRKRIINLGRHTADKPATEKTENSDPQGQVVEICFIAVTFM